MKKNIKIILTIFMLVLSSTMFSVATESDNEWPGEPPHKNDTITFGDITIDNSKDIGEIVDIYVPQDDGYSRFADVDAYGTVTVSVPYTLTNSDPDASNPYSYCQAIITCGSSSDSDWDKKETMGSTSNTFHLEIDVEEGEVIEVTLDGWYTDDEKSDENTKDDDIQVSFFEMDNENPPSKPSITGPSVTLHLTDTWFQTSSSDPDDNDKLKYMFDWGDGDDTEWITDHTPGNSPGYDDGEECWAGHAWECTNLGGSYYKVCSFVQDIVPWPEYGMEPKDPVKSKYHNIRVRFFEGIQSAELNMSMTNGNFEFVPQGQPTNPQCDQLGEAVFVDINYDGVYDEIWIDIFETNQTIIDFGISSYDVDYDSSSDTYSADLTDDDQSDFDISSDDIPIDDVSSEYNS